MSSASRTWSPVGQKIQIVQPRRETYLDQLGNKHHGERILGATLIVVREEIREGDNGYGSPNIWWIAQDSQGNEFRSLRDQVSYTPNPIWRETRKSVSEVHWRQWNHMNKQRCFIGSADNPQPFVFEDWRA